MSEKEDLPVVFLIGAGRSGTTLLYKTLSLHEDIAYLSNHHNKFPSTSLASSFERLVKDHPDIKLKSWFKNDGSANARGARTFLDQLVPQPAECEAVYTRCGVPLVASSSSDMRDTLVATDHSRKCLRRTFRSVLRVTGGKVLLTKRTANNRRIEYLQSVFPEARFVHLIRDGRAVAYSLTRVSWWGKYVPFWSDKTPEQMIRLGEDPVESAARNWIEEMAWIEKGLSSIAPQNLYELHYENFLAEPDAVLEKLFEFIGIPAAMEGRYGASIAALALKPENVGWKTAWTDEQQRLVNTIQESVLSRTGYK